MRLSVDEIERVLASGRHIELRGGRASGKTATLRRLHRHFEGAGRPCLLLSGSVTSSGLPLAVVAFAGYTGEGNDLTTRVAAAAQRMARALKNREGIICVDDADLVDEASLAAVAAAVRASGARTIFAPRRQAPVPETLASEFLPRATFRIPPMTRDQVHQMIQKAVSGPVDPSLVARILAKSSGLPGICRAIIASLLDERRLWRSEGLFTLEGSVWSDELAGALESLLTGLSPAAVAALRTLSDRGPYPFEEASRSFLGDDQLAELDDHGLLATMGAGRSMLINVEPPILAEYFRRSEHPLDHYRRATAGYDPGGDADVEDPGRGRIDAGPINRLIASRVSEALRRHSQEWLHEPSVAHALPYVDTLLAQPADPGQIQTVFDRTVVRDAAEAVDMGWRKALLELFGRRNPDEAIRIVEQAERETPAYERSRRLAEINTMRIEHMAMRAIGQAERTPSAVATFATAERDLFRGLIGEAREAVAEAGLRADSDVAELLQHVVEMLDGSLITANALAGARLRQAIEDADLEAIFAFGFAGACGAWLAGDLDLLRSCLNAVLAINHVPYAYIQFYVVLLRLAQIDCRRRGEVQLVASYALRADQLAVADGPLPFTVCAIPESGEEGERIWRSARESAERGYLLSALLTVADLLSSRVDPSAQRREWARIASAWAETANGRVLTAIASWLDAIASDSLAGLQQANRKLRDAGLRRYALACHADIAVKLQGSHDSERLRESLQELRAEAVEIWGDAQALGAAMPEFSLTSREREIAILLAQGQSNKQIAAALVLSVRTVENHVQRILLRSGSKQRKTAVANLKLIGAI